MIADRKKSFKQEDRIPLQLERASPQWQRYAIDSLLAVAGVALVSSIIVAIHQYAGLPSIMLTYLLLIAALAYMRGTYAAILATLMAGMAFDFFFTPPLYRFSFIDLYSLSVDDLLDPWVFMATGIISGWLIVTLRRRAEQAGRREQEAHQLAALQERQRLARELHDSVSQALYCISLGTRTAREALDSDPREAVAPLDYVIFLTQASIAEMRALIFELRPESLATEGLVNALDKQLAVLRTRYKLAIEAELGEEPMIPLEDKQALNRIAQEALHNIVKHAGASTVTLRLARQDGELLLEVGDDGMGFDPTEPFPGHFGLRSMQERATQLGGTCFIESVPGQGTHVCVRIPIH